MRISKAIPIHLPSYLVERLKRELEESPPAFAYDENYFYYLLNHIHNRHLRNKDSDFVTLQSNTFIYYWNTNKYIQYLINGDLIKSDNIYIPAQKAKGYQIVSEMLSGKVMSVDVKPKSRLYEKIKKSDHKQIAHLNRLEPHIRAMRDYFINMDMDYLRAIKWAKNEPSEIKRMNYLLSIENLRYKRTRYFKRNKVNNRLDTNLTNLKSELRQFIIGDFVSIDLANSQPFFLSQIINNIINTNTTPTPNTLCRRFECLDLSELINNQSVTKIQKSHQNSLFSEMVTFMNSVKEGRFYNDFIELFNLDRLEVKKIMFAVLFSRNVVYKKYQSFIPYQKEKEVFISVYPGLYEIIQHMKRKDHSKLAISLQRLESYVFIDVIAKRLVEAGVTPLTIHDSVIIPSEKTEEVITVMRNTFKELFEVIPTFHITKISKTVLKNNYTSETAHH